MCLCDSFLGMDRSQVNAAWWLGSCVYDVGVCGLCSFLVLGQCCRGSSIVLCSSCMVAVG
jgi:hypothetical protein